MFEWSSIWVAEEDPILGKYPDAKEGTWEQEYQNCVRNMESRINGELPSIDREINQDVAIWYDSLNRQETGSAGYPYCCYIFPCQGDGYGAALCAYGEKEDCCFISWEEEDYLVIVQRAEGEIRGISVYGRFGESLAGGRLELEKQPDGEIKLTCYICVNFF